MSGSNLAVVVSITCSLARPRVAATSILAAAPHTIALADFAAKLTRIAPGNNAPGWMPAEEACVFTTKAEHLGRNIGTRRIVRSPWCGPLTINSENAHRLFVTCALVNLFVSRRKLLAASVGSSLFAVYARPERHCGPTQHPRPEAAARFSEH